MKWMLVVLVFETSAVKTDLIFDSLEACLAAEQEARSAWVSAWNERSTKWQGETDDDYEVRMKFNSSRLLAHPAACIPHSD